MVISSFFSHFLNILARSVCRSCAAVFMRTPWKAYAGTKEGQDRAQEEWFQLLRMFEKELNGKDFLGRKTIGFADIVGFSLAVWHGIVKATLGGDLITEDKCSQSYSNGVASSMKSLLPMNAVFHWRGISKYLRARIEAFKSAVSK